MYLSLICYDWWKILGYVLNSYDDAGNRPNSKIHQTSRVDQVIYPSSNDTKVGREQLESGPMLSLALKIHNDTRQEIKVRLLYLIY
jgi:hypothetical protein